MQREKQIFKEKSAEKKKLEIPDFVGQMYVFIFASLFTLKKSLKQKQNDMF